MTGKYAFAPVLPVFCQKCQGDSGYFFFKMFTYYSHLFVRCYVPNSGLYTVLVPCQNILSHLRDLWTVNVLIRLTGK